jgi:hypothetical protein
VCAVAYDAETPAEKMSSWLAAKSTKGRSEKRRQSDTRVEQKGGEKKPPQQTHVDASTSSTFARSAIFTDAIKFFT